MLPHRHYMLDAYGCLAEQADNTLIVNDVLTQVAHDLNMQPVMPPFLIPYYYCDDAEDVGVSAFCICAGGEHITIHTFPYRSCYFADILTSQFFTQEEASKLFQKQIFANDLRAKIVDKRTDFDQTEPDINESVDFGPHYLISVANIDMTMEKICVWLDTVAEKINMLPISRPYVIFDKVEDPEYISGFLVVAQSHISVHYSIKERVASIDIFSCSFLDNGIIESILKQSFGDETQIKLIARGSKYVLQCQQHSRKSRIEKNRMWRNNI